MRRRVAVVEIKRVGGRFPVGRLRLVRFFAANLLAADGAAFDFEAQAQSDGRR